MMYGARCRDHDEQLFEDGVFHMLTKPLIQSQEPANPFDLIQTTQRGKITSFSSHPPPHTW